MSQKLSRDDRAMLIRIAEQMADLVTELRDILLPEEPEEGPCNHPAHKVEDISTIGEPMYLCTQCGKEQSVPFIHHQ